MGEGIFRSSHIGVSEEFTRKEGYREDEPPGNCYLPYKDGIRRLNLGKRVVSYQKVSTVGVLKRPATVDGYEAASFQRGIGQIRLSTATVQGLKGRGGDTNP